MIKISPSLLSADFGDLRTEVKKLAAAGADWLHFDVMDGCFVPNLTFGAPLIKSVRAAANLPFDVHLMIDNPQPKLKWFANAGADIITVHAEACANLEQTLKDIRALGCKAGVSIKPATSAQILQPLLNEIDLVLIMTVEPGFGGQSFMQEQLQKVEQLKKMTATRNIEIEVDGGINPQTAKQAIAAGATVLVAGTAVFKKGAYAENIKSLRQGE